MKISLEEATDVALEVRKKLDGLILSAPKKYTFGNSNTYSALCNSAANMVIDNLCERGFSLDDIKVFEIAPAGHYVIGVNGTDFDSCIKIDPTATQFKQDQIVFPPGQYLPNIGEINELSLRDFFVEDDRADSRFEPFEDDSFDYYRSKRLTEKYLKSKQNYCQQLKQKRREDYLTLMSEPIDLVDFE